MRSGLVAALFVSLPTRAKQTCERPNGKKAKPHTEYATTRMAAMTAEIESHTFFGAVRPYRLRVAFTYGVMFLENILELLYPFAIGLAINDLIAGKGALSLAPFAGIWFFQLVTATGRQLYDTRLFARIYGEVAGRMIIRQREAGVSTGEVAARSVMAREAV